MGLNDCPVSLICIDRRRDMKLFKIFKEANSQKPKRQTAKDEEIRRAMYIAGKTVGNRNPMSRGQGYSGESKLAVLQMMQDDD